MTVCITERTYEDGDWIITEKITHVIGNEISEYVGSDYIWDPLNPFDTGWIYTVDKNVKYRTYIMSSSTDASTQECCLEEA